MVSAYLSNQLGFSETGKYVLDNLIKPKILEAGIQINDPFERLAEELDFAYLSKLDRHEDVQHFWDTFSKKVTPINNGLMLNSDCMVALLDGGHAVDDGVASEIGYFSALKLGPIFALRSDVRLGENLAVTINPQVLGYITESGGELFEGPRSIERWAAAINNWAQTQFLSRT